MTRSRLTAALLAASCMSLMACEASHHATASSVETSAAATSTTDTVSAAPTPASPAEPAEYAVRDLLASLDPDTAIYLQHLATVSNPYFEGRSADVPGKRMVAEYFAHWFEEYGLEPAFASEDGSASYFQPFEVRGGIDVTAAAATWSAGGAAHELAEGEDFNILGFSANAEASGPVVFVGYSIEDGEDDYSSFDEDTDLTGKIAMLFRFEPMDDQGDSLWSSRRWSRHAGLVGKIQNAVDRGAAGVILVNPPGANDPRVESLPDVTSTRFGRMDVPAIALSIDAADRLVRASDPEGRSIYQLRKTFDDAATSGPIELSQGGLTVSMQAGMERRQLPTQNVGGVLAGRGALANEWVIIGGHYDHVGYGRLSGASPSNVGKLHPGADDNASGAVGVMLIAKNLVAAYAEMDESADARSILFLEFGAEEMGLLGAEHYVENMEMSASQVICMLNLDMIGRVRDGRVEADGMGSAEEMEDVMAPHFAATSLDVASSSGVAGNSDHAVFYRADIPSSHFFTGLHPDYHRPGDTFEKVNFEGAVQVCHLIESIALDMATRPTMMTFKRATRAGSGRNRTGASVRLGIAPGSYGEDDEPGVEVGDVFEGTSADEGGIKAGDRMIRWDGDPLNDVSDMMGKLGAAKPGDVAEIVVVRDGKEVVLKVTLKAREG